LHFIAGNTALANGTDTTPQFTVVQETTKYQVFVLDISGSMWVSTHSKSETILWVYMCILC